jgi:hypothetical protein
MLRKKLKVQSQASLGFWNIPAVGNGTDVFEFISRFCHFLAGCSTQSVFFFFPVVAFELRALRLLGRHFTI